MLKIQKILTGVVLILVIASIYFYVKVYNRPHVNMANISTKVKINSSDLVTLFILDEETANLAYVEKIIEVEGTIKEITYQNNINTVLLRSNIDSSSVICEMQKNQLEEVKKFQKGERVRIKGICKGFLMDAVVLNCIIVTNE